MEFTKEQIAILEDLSGTKYTVKEIAMYFSIPEKELQKEYEDPESLFRYHYDRGILKVKAELDLSRMEAARNGNITAIQILDRRMAQADQENFKNTLLNGD
jgi:hypothetical protein